jgi:hypothetical protein
MFAYRFLITPQFVADNPAAKARLLDREADAVLQQGRHALAEYLATQAAALRQAVAP